MPRTTERSIGPIDPHARQAEFIGGHDIGAQALPHVENPFTWNTECGEVFDSEEFRDMAIEETAEAGEVEEDE